MAIGMGPRRRFRLKGEWGVEYVPAGKSGLTMALGLDPFKNAPSPLPTSASRRRDAAPVQCGGDLPKRLRSCGLRLADRRHDFGGVRLGVGLEAAMGDGAGVG